MVGKVLPENGYFILILILIIIVTLILATTAYLSLIVQED